MRMTEEQQAIKGTVSGNTPPTGPELTDYDRAHMQAYLRLLDAAASGVPWTVAVRDILHVDPSIDPAAAKVTFDTHLARAEWMTRVGYRLLQDQHPRG